MQPRHAKQKKGKRFVRRGALSAALIASVASLSVSAAASLGGARVDSLGGANADLSQTEGLTLDWNPDSLADGTTTLSEVRVTDDDGTLDAGSELKVTVKGVDDTTCEAAGETSEAASTLTLQFEDCSLQLWDSATVSAVYTNGEKTTTYQSDLGPIAGTLDGFSGTVVDATDSSEPQVTYGTGTDSGTVRSVQVTTPNATPAALDGGQMAVLFYEDEDDTQPDIYVGTVSAAGDTGTGVVAEASGDGSSVTMTFASLPGSSTSPATIDASNFKVLITQKQRIGSAVEGTSAYGAYVASGIVRQQGTGTEEGTGGSGEPGGTEQNPNSGDSTIPIEWTAGLEYVRQDGDPTLSGSVNYCVHYSVTNTTSEPLQWKLVFDTTSAPMWATKDAQGNYSLPAVNSWNMNSEYDTSTGKWTITGVTNNGVLAPGQTDNTVGYCTTGVQVPDADPSLYSASVRVEPNANGDYVSLYLDVTSDYQYPLRWVADIDLADYVCAATLPTTLTAPWGVSMEKAEGSSTKYTIRGTSDGWPTFVRSGADVSVYLGGYSVPQGQYLLGCTG